jgi:DNA-binding NarL/FixJ family response regulator
MPKTVSNKAQAAEYDNDEFFQRLSILTPKQFRVLMMLVEGRTNSEIADESFVTIATIKAHLSEIFKKLEVSNRTQAAMIAANYLEIKDPNSQILE